MLGAFLADRLLPSLAVVGVIGVVIAFVFVVIALAARHAKSERERTAAIAAFAQSRGCLMRGEYPRLHTLFHFFPLFKLGHSRRGYNVAFGNIRIGGIGCEVLFGDYDYKVTTSNGKQTTVVTHTTSVIITRPILEVPEQLTVREEGFFDRIGEFLGIDDIDFESSEFSKRFHVKCSDRRFAFDLFDPRMIEYFLGSKPPKMEFLECVLLCTRGAGRWKIEQFAAEMEWVDGFYAHVPRHVRAERLPAAEHASDPILSPSDGASA